MLDSLLNFHHNYNLFEVGFEVAVIGLFVYVIYRFLETTRGSGVLRGMAIVAILLTVSIKFVGDATESLARLRFIYERLLSILTMLLIVVFQPELRQAMVRIGEVVSRRQARRSDVVDEIDAAVQFLSRSQFGAIIVIERSMGLGSLVEGGVRLDAIVSSRLLQSIFYPNNPLHDLAVVIRADRVMAANVQLPLADVGVVPGELGSRHRAAVGVTVESDCLAVVVSEERGTIRTAERGKLSAPIPRERFGQLLASTLAGESSGLLVNAGNGSAQEPGRPGEGGAMKARS